MRPITGETSLTSPDELPAVHRTALATGTVLAGRYRVERLIGEGGMGDVYLATHLKIDKPVAIKILAPEQMRRAKTVSRFLQEAKAASKIRHPNVVDITDFGEADGCAFLVMEFLEGEDLDALLKRERTLPWDRAKRIVVQLLQALSAAHAAGIFHRDIKPHNCFMTSRAPDRDFVKIIDFGIAKLRVEGSEEQLTRTGAIMGTAEYMSPEQGLGTEVDGRTDLYSVGVILYRMLTGEVPFVGNNPMAVLYQHIHSPWVPPSQARPESKWGPRIDALVAKALAKDREARFASAEAFIAAIEAIEQPHADAVARPRRRTGIALAGVAMAVAVGVAGWALTRPEPAARSSSAEPAVVVAPVVEPAPAKRPVPAASQPVPVRPAEVPLAEPTTQVESPSAVVRPVTAQRSDRSMAAALGKTADDVRACAKQAGLFPGERVRVTLDISAPGQITQTVVHGAFSAAGRSCIDKAVRKAKLGRAGKVQTYEHSFEI